MLLLKLYWKTPWVSEAGIHGNIIFAGLNHKKTVNGYMNLKQMFNSFKQGSHKSYDLTDMKPIKMHDYAYP